MVCEEGDPNPDSSNGYDMICTESVAYWDCYPDPSCNPYEDDGGGGGEEEEDPCNGADWVYYPECYYDECEFYGTCDDGSDPDLQVDCAGVTGGTAYMADCGCIGGTTGIVSCPNPCDKLKSQSLNADYKAKITELGNKTGLKHETGYAETKSGTFNPLVPGASTANSDNLKINITDNTKGFTHTHLDDYETGKVTNDDIPIINKPIKMFSPADVDVLMELVQANNTTGDYSVY